MGQANVGAGGTVEGWKPKEDETEEDAEWRVANRLKVNLGELEGREKTWGTVPLGSMSISEMAASMMVNCDYPDDGSAHVCPQEPSSVHELMSIKMRGKTYNCCYSCWRNKHAVKDRVLEQFKEVGGYDPQRDLPLNQSRKIFKILTRRLHSQEQGRVPYDPTVSAEALETACRNDFNHSTHHLVWRMTCFQTCEHGATRRL